VSLKRVDPKTPPKGGNASVINQRVLVLIILLPGKEPGCEGARPGLGVWGFRVFGMEAEQR
jgi:hypothetical protein